MIRRFFIGVKFFGMFIGELKGGRIVQKKGNVNESRWWKTRRGRGERTKHGVKDSGSARK